MVLEKFDLAPESKSYIDKRGEGTGSLLRFPGFIINPKFGNLFAFRSFGFQVFKKVLILYWWGILASLAERCDNRGDLWRCGNPRGTSWPNEDWPWLQAESWLCHFQFHGGKSIHFFGLNRFICKMGVGGNLISLGRDSKKRCQVLHGRLEGGVSLSLQDVRVRSLVALSGGRKHLFSLSRSFCRKSPVQGKTRDCFRHAFPTCFYPGGWSHPAE